MLSGMSRIFYLWFNPRELPPLFLGSIAYVTKARWCCLLHHPSSTAFVSKNRNHCPTCWILPKAGPKVWFPKVLSRWRSWVGLGVCFWFTEKNMCVTRRDWDAHVCCSSCNHDPVRMWRADGTRVACRLHERAVVLRVHHVHVAFWY